MLKLKFVLFLFISLAATTHCLAQTENINTDRPDQSDGVYTVPKHLFQLEDGVTLAEETFLNNFMLRYGLTSSTEIRLVSDAGRELEAKGFKPLTLSAKQRIMKQRGVLPALTFVGYVAFEKIASPDFQGCQIPVELKLAFENELNDRLSISYNVGTSDEFEALNLTFNFGYSPTNRVSTFVEYFSTFTQSVAAHNVDLGILFVVKPQLQFDLAGGASLDDLGEGLYTTFGVSYIFR